MKKVLVIGLDCADPGLVFKQYIDDLPNLKALMSNGVWGRLESCLPPITVPAWSSMLTSKDPGELGFYGFRNRKDHSYDGLFFANSSSVKEKTVWDILTQNHKKSILLGIPQTYPPKPVNGYMVTCFLTPSTKSEYTYPPELKAEVEQVADGYMLDVDDFRTENKKKLLADIYRMTEKRFRVARHLMTTKVWDFCMLVEMGVDRLQHGFWKYSDPTHIKFDPHTEFVNVTRDYYKYIDQEIGRLLTLIDRENTAVIVVSDHGAQKMDGGICINEWLMRQGYLTLKEKPPGVIPANKMKIDWEKTYAWGEGGYYSRIFLNVKGREPQGAVAPEDYENVRNKLIAELEALGDDKGHPIGTRVYKPEEIYRTCNGVPPDLIALFGNLYWRSVGSVGLNTIHTFDNDTGPDDANHAQHGIFVMNTNDMGQKGCRENLQIMDVAPTILHLLGITPPDDMHGKII
ncbi:MAG: alkaline phosphatase family protein [Candidatus Schekmanbacteria bacterium]|nr:alkaline phosphatase family protein [Candidatus Schekmanbacteria bacterium]